MKKIVLLKVLIIEIYKLFIKEPLESILLYAISVNPNIALKFLNNLSKIKIETNGNDLIKLGIPTGEIYKEIFEYITGQKIKHPQITKEKELLLIKEKFLCS